MRFSPRQSDLMIVAGRVTIKMMPVLQHIYQQMTEPKWVISMGACASTGGVFDAYATIQGIDQFMPVDVYVPGCPPRPETLIEGIMAIQRIIDEEGMPAAGRRRALQIAVEPSHFPAPQPVAVPLGHSAGNPCPVNSGSEPTGSASALLSVNTRTERAESGWGWRRIRPVVFRGGWPGSPGQQDVHEHHADDEEGERADHGRDLQGNRPIVSPGDGPEEVAHGPPAGGFWDG